MLAPSQPIPCARSFRKKESCSNGIWKRRKSIRLALLKFLIPGNLRKKRRRRKSIAAKPRSQERKKPILKLQKPRLPEPRLRKQTMRQKLLRLFRMRLQKQRLLQLRLPKHRALTPLRKHRQHNPKYYMRETPNIFGV